MPAPCCQLSIGADTKERIDSSQAVVGPWAPASEESRGERFKAAAFSPGEAQVLVHLGEMKAELVLQLQGLEMRLLEKLLARLDTEQNLAQQEVSFSDGLELAEVKEENQRLREKLAKLEEESAGALVAQKQEPKEDVKRSSGLSDESKEPNTELARTKSSFIEHVSKHDPMNAFSPSLHGFLDLWNALEEPPPKGAFLTWVAGEQFQQICGVVIFLYVVFLVVSTNHQVTYPSEDLPESMQLAEYVFLGFFTFEITLKLVAHKLFFFVNRDAGWNIFDFLVVLFSLVGEFAPDTHTNVNPSFLRTIRLCRLVKVLQAFRLVRVINGLRQMIECTVHSLAVLWACILTLWIFIFIFSVIFVQRVAGYLAQDHPDAEEQYLKDIFGGVARGMISLFMTISGGTEWEPIYHALKRIGIEYSWLLLFFEAFAQIALLNIILAQFVECCKHWLQGDVEDDLTTKRKAQNEKLKKLLECLEKYNKGAGPSQKEQIITREQFRTEMKDGKGELRKILEEWGLYTADADLFFRSIEVQHKQLGGSSSNSSNADGVNVSDFAHDCLKLDGGASASDMQLVLANLRQIRHDMAPPCLSSRISRNRRSSAPSLSFSENDPPN